MPAFFNEGSFTIHLKKNVMKSRLFIMTLLSLFLSSAYGMYIEPAPTLSAMRKDSSGVYMVSYTDAKAGKVILTIDDAQGNLLARKVIQNENGFLLPINLSSVAEGEYTIRTNNGTEKASTIIVYSNNTAPTYSRVVNLGEDQYLFTSSHAGKETITITIYDENGQLVFSENRKVHGYFSMLFNLKNVTGNPYFEVTETTGNSLMVPGNPVITNIK